MLTNYSGFLHKSEPSMHRKRKYKHSTISCYNVSLPSMKLNLRGFPGVTSPWPSVDSHPHGSNNPWRWKSPWKQPKKNGSGLVESLFGKVGSTIIIKRCWYIPLYNNINTTLKAHLHLHLSLRAFGGVEIPKILNILSLNPFKSVLVKWGCPSPPKWNLKKLYIYIIYIYRFGTLKSLKKYGKMHLD